MKQLCRTCQYYDLEYAKSAGGRVRTHAVAECRYQVPPITLPDSVTGHYSYTGRFNQRFMQPNDGAACPCWKPIEAKK